MYIFSTGNQPPVWAAGTPEGYAKTWRDGYCGIQPLITESETHIVDHEGVVMHINGINFQIMKV